MQNVYIDVELGFQNNLIVFVLAFWHLEAHFAEFLYVFWVLNISQKISKNWKIEFLSKEQKICEELSTLFWITNGKIISMKIYKVLGCDVGQNGRDGDL